MLSNAAVKVSLIILGLTVAAFLVQKTLHEDFPGNYPKFTAPVEASFEFIDKQVHISVPKELNDFHVLVFAYDSQGHMQAVLKPVVEGTIEVNQGDNSDIDVRFGNGDQVAGFELLKRMDSYIREVDMFNALKEARANGRQTGIQRCLYPLCTRCIDGCRSVIKVGDLALEMHKGEDGAIRPVYFKGKCPRCGKCFVWCPVKVITMSGSLSGK
ncbi:MAG: 4Fe-4S ferredoxin [Syntrophobacteraceae bacterium]